MGTHTLQHTCVRAGDNFGEWILSFHKYVAVGFKLRPLGLFGKHFFPPSHLSGKTLLFEKGAVIVTQGSEIQLD